MDSLDDLTEEERAFIFGSSGTNDISSASSGSTYSAPKSSIVEKKKDVMVECPLCLKYFPQDRIERHASSCILDLDNGIETLTLENKKKDGTCSICSQIHSQTTLYALVHCNHAFSIDCLQRLFRQQTSNNPSFDIKITCPDCRNEVSWSDIIQILPVNEYCKFSCSLRNLFLEKIRTKNNPRFQMLGEFYSSLEKLKSHFEVAKGVQYSNSHPNQKPKMNISKTSGYETFDGTGFGGRAGESSHNQMLTASNAETKRDTEIEKCFHDLIRMLNEIAETIHFENLFAPCCQAFLSFSGLESIIIKYLINDSLHDIANSRSSIYHTLFLLIRTLVNEPYLYLLDKNDEHHKEFNNLVSKENKQGKKEDETNSETSILQLLKKQKCQADILIKHISKSEDFQDEQNTDLVSIGLEFADVCLVVEDALWKGSSSNEKEDSQLNEKQRYLKAMTPLQYKSIDIDFQRHHYVKEITATEKTQPSREKVKRLYIEVPSLSTSLPLNFESSIFFRVDENRLDVIKALIIGPEGTPYENGCFQFDIFVPQEYPQVPPLVHFLTTGGGTVRFNPNLYNCGKLCLSLLGTWSGPGWDSKNSTLLQVFLSIQSLILVSEPYYNEPGYSHNPAQSELYNQHIRYETLRVAMSSVLKNPDPEFEDVIKTHFESKGTSILKQIRDWENKANPNYKSHFRQLSQELENLIQKL